MEPRASNWEIFGRNWVVCFALGGLPKLIQCSYIKILNIACQLLFDGEDGLSMIRFNCIHLHIASCNMSTCCNMFLTGSQKKL